VLLPLSKISSLNGPNPTIPSADYAQLLKTLCLAAVLVGALAFLAMLAVTVIWMTVPKRIVYRESPPVQTGVFSVEVKQHGKSYFVTPGQKKTLDNITNGTPIVWFSSLAVAVLATLVGAGARLRLPDGN
jgi:hypothetical protein